MIKRTPSLRFKGFVDEWEEKTLGEIGDVTKLAGFEFTEYVVYSDSGNIIALRGLNIKNGKLVLDDVKYIDKSNFSKLNRSKLIIDDLLLTYVGTVGEVAIIDEDNKYYLAPNVSRIRLQNNYIANFLSQQVGSESFYNNMIFPLIATSSQPALSMENVRKFKIAYCSTNEQTKIGNLFKTLDTRIAQQQKKHDALVNVKKALLQKMFPQSGKTLPEVRFKGFEEEWEEKTLGEVTTYTSSSLVAENKKEIGEYRLFDANTCIGFIDTDNMKEEYITIVKDGAGVGRVRKLPRNTAFIGTMGGITPKEADIDFLFNILETTDFKSDISGGTIPHIYYSQYSGNLYRIAKIEEQTKIGSLFKTVDNLIDLNKQKLEKLKDIKKACLEKMFV